MSFQFQSAFTGVT